MAHPLDSLFRVTPRPFKDALCSLYGYRIHRQRYGGNHRRHLEQALAEERLSADALRELSLRRLRETLIRAANEVPYYRNLFRELGIDAATLELPSELARIPILEQATLRERPAEFISDAMRGIPLESRETSGTSGSPLRVLADLDSLRRHYAVYDRFRGWAGSAMRRRRATFNGRVLWPAGRGRPPFWVKDLTENNLLFSVYHLGPQYLPSYVRALRSYEPWEIHAYPSALSTVARFATRHGLELPRPVTIITSAETLHDADRRLFEEAFGCRVFDQYGNAEMTVFAGQCPEGSLHLDIGYSHVEVLGEAGEIVTTGFVNRAMPLIRYRLGDAIRLDEATCRCGRPQPVVAAVLGRTDDVLLLPDGREVGRLDPVFKGLEGLDEVQIVQSAPDRVVMKVVPGPGYGDRAEQAMIAALADRLGPSVEIRAEVVSSIPGTGRGKRRAVVRLFDR